MNPQGAVEPDGLRAWRREEGAAFVDAHYRGVYRFFLWLTNDPEAAADLTQESFAAFWESMGRQDRASVPDLKAWLYGIARNRWRTRCRDWRAEHPVPPLRLGAGGSVPEEALELPDETPGPDAVILAAIEAEAVVEAVARMPLDYREALVLRVFQELSYAQIGKALGISDNLARWRVHRGRLWLRSALEPEGLKEEAGVSA